MHIRSTAVRVVVIVSVAITVTIAACNLNLLSAEGTVWLLELGLDPLHEAVVVENVFARCLANHCGLIKVFYTDGAALLVLLVLSILEFFSRK